MPRAAAAQPKQWAREYETIYILRPTVESDLAEKVAQRVQDVMGKQGGKITKVDNWGRRDLAYPINKFRRGIFVYLRYAGYGDLVAELERNLRLLDDVVRYQTVVLVDMVDLDTVTVDSEEVKFLPIEEGEDAPSVDLAERLGIAESSPRKEDEDKGSEEESFGADAAIEETVAEEEGEIASDEGPAEPEAKEKEEGEA